MLLIRSLLCLYLLGYASLSLSCAFDLRTVNFVDDRCPSHKVQNFKKLISKINLIKENKRLQKENKNGSCSSLNYKAFIRKVSEKLDKGSFFISRRINDFERSFIYFLIGIKDEDTELIEYSLNSINCPKYTILSYLVSKKYGSPSEQEVIKKYFPGNVQKFLKNYKLLNLKYKLDKQSYVSVISYLIDIKFFDINPYKKIEYILKIGIIPYDFYWLIRSTHYQKLLDNSSIAKLLYRHGLKLIYDSPKSGLNMYQYFLYKGQDWVLRIPDRQKFRFHKNRTLDAFLLDQLEANKVQSSTVVEESGVTAFDYVKRENLLYRYFRFLTQNTGSEKTDILIKESPIPYKIKNPKNIIKSLDKLSIDFAERRHLDTRYLKRLKDYFSFLSIVLDNKKVEIPSYKKIWFRHQIEMYNLSLKELIETKK